MMIWTTILFIGLMGRLSAGSAKTDAAKELLSIINNSDQYDKNIFPKESGPINVGVNMYLRGMEIDDINMRLKVDMTFRMMWQDRRLKYSAAGVKNVRFINYEKFWLPDPFFKSSIDTNQIKTIHPEAYISITSRGNITFSSRFQVVSKCPMDLSRFPHDQQVCSIKVASYGYAKDDIIFSFDSGTPIEVKGDLSTSNYKMLSYSTDTCDSKTSTGDYSCLMITITLRRQFSTYLVEWYFPCMCFVVLAFFSELIAVDALLPRLILTIGPLLTLATSSMAYSSKFASVTYVKAMDIFSGFSLLTIFATCLHVIIGYYYANKEQPEKAESIDLETATKLQKFKLKLTEKGDYFARISIIGFYVVFVFLYFLAYST